MKPLNNLSQGQIEAWSQDTLIAESQNGTRISHIAERTLEKALADLKKR